MVIAKYEKIHQELQEQILSGKFHDGKLPPLAILTKIYEANPATVSKAVKLLEQEKLVQCGPGSVGTVINANEVKRRRRESSFYAGGWDKAAYLRYAVFRGAEDPCKDMYLEQVKAFQERYPGIEIEIVYVSNRDQLEERCGKVDVFQYCAREKDFLLQHGRLADIGKYLEALPPDPSFIPPDSRHSGMPFLFNTPVMIINRDLLRKPIRSWEDLSEQISRGEIILNLGTLPFFYHWIGDLGENLCSGSSLDRLETAMSMLRSMQGQGIEIGGCRVPEEFLNGQVPVYVAYTSYLQFLPEKLPFECDVVLTPRPAGISPLSETVFNGISPGCTTPVEAYLFTRFLASAEAQEIMAKYRYALPVNRGVLDKFRRERCPNIDFEALSGSRFTLGISWWAIVNLENSNTRLIRQGIENGLGDAEIVKSIQERAVEYLKLDHLR